LVILYFTETIKLVYLLHSIVMLDHILEYIYVFQNAFIPLFII